MKNRMYERSSDIYKQDDQTVWLSGHSCFDKTSNTETFFK